MQSKIEPIISQGTRAAAQLTPNACPGCRSEDVNCQDRGGL